MRARYWLALTFSHLLVAIIAVALWAERSEIADHLRVPIPPVPIHEDSIAYFGDTGPIGPVTHCLELHITRTTPELDTVHLANFGVPPLRTVKPKLLPLAQHANAWGTVILEVTVGKDGTVENIHAQSGHPLLIPAAIDAIKQWRWKPFLLNGRPLRVISNVAVQFPQHN